MTGDISMAGVEKAEKRCGPWPVAGTLADYVAARDRALREVGLVIELRERWVHRFGPGSHRSLNAIGRLADRVAVAADIYERRQRLLRLLTESARGEA
jgi:hypothetical protein